MAESSLSDSAIEPWSLNPDSDLSFTVNNREEIDTSSPFVSVREAANRFGGFGFWRPHEALQVSLTFQENGIEGDIMELKRQAVAIQKDLIVKECETDEVLKELEAIKAIVIEINSKLEQRKNKEEVHSHIKPAFVVLKDLNKAKMNLCKRTVDLAGLRGSVEVLSKQLKEERKALEKTRERLMEKSLKVISLEEDKKGETSKKDALRMINEVQRLNSEAQEFKKAGEKAMAEIEHTREKIKTVKIKLVAARKMKEAARAAEAVAMAEIKVVTGDAVTVTISAEEYAKLAGCARDAEEEARKRVEDAMSRVEEAKDTLKKVEEAVQEVETRKKALEEAVERADTANATKLEAEEALRNWKSEKGQRRRLSSSVNNTAKFKSKRETTTTSLMDVNGLHLTYDVVVGPSSSSVPVLKPTMSIGQILSKKLLVAEDSDMMNVVASQRRKMSLGQMLAKNSSVDGTPSKKSEGKENGKRSATTLKRKNLGFAKIALLLNKEGKNKKKSNKIALNLR
ncbi:hypothetical protein N665_0611s0034 [Sinapis alba]|nr:hypothetical protein N665_0611s0034 [Sinapis alba]